MKYRYNIFSSFRISKGDKIEVMNFCLSKKIILDYDDSLYKFLSHISQHIFFSQQEITKYEISENIIKLLIYYKIVDYYHSSSWIEAITFNQLTKNPNCCQEKPDFEYINFIYKNFDKGFSEFLWSNFEILNKKLVDLNFSIVAKTFNDIKSTRLKESYKSNSDINIIEITNFIFKKRASPFENRFYFWSGGWLSSIFPIIISKNDEVFIYDKFSEKFYIKLVPDIRKLMENKWFVPCETNFGAYDYYVFLFSDTEKVFEKYWNKAYRLLFLEAWQISFLFRLFCSNFDKAQLEVQWFYDDIIMDILVQNDILNEKKIKNLMVLHTLVFSE